MSLIAIAAGILWLLIRRATRRPTWIEMHVHHYHHHDPPSRVPPPPDPVRLIDDELRRVVREHRRTRV